MGLKNTLACGFSYAYSLIFKKRENSLENFYINRFGKKLYSMFFEHYTENLWGRHPSKIDPSWGKQRVKGVSILSALKNTLFIKNQETETSFIEEFSYPKYGPGQLWEEVARKVEDLGGEIKLGSKTTKLFYKINRINEITYEKEGKEYKLNPDIVISSMPLKDLVLNIEGDMPQKYKDIAKGLPYRDYITIGVLIPKMSLLNTSKYLTLGKYIPDNWIYIHDRSVKMGRMQIYNNWSPYMVKDPKNTVWIGLEYFCNETDDIWNFTETEFITLAKTELVASGFIKDDIPILDANVVKVKKAYPAYFDSYNRINELKAYLDFIKNLWCIGRNGQHRYNNMDHSMLTALKTVDHILSNNDDKTEIWDVNTEEEYHEKK